MISLLQAHFLKALFKRGVICFVALSLIMQLSLFAQQNKIDSLSQVLMEQVKDDSVQFDMMLVYKNRIDSLFGLLSNHHKEDTVKVNLMNELAYAFIRLVWFHRDSARIELAMDYIQKSLDLSEKLHYKFGIIQAQNLRGSVAYGMEHYYEAYGYYKKVEQQYIEINDTLGLYKICHNIMCVFFGLGDLENTQAMANRLFELGQEILSRSEQGNAEVTGSYASAISLLFDIISYWNTPPDEVETAVLEYLITNMDVVDPMLIWFVERRYAQMMTFQNQKEKALEYAHKTAASLELTAFYDQKWAYMVLSEIHVMLKNADSAKYYMDKTRVLPTDTTSEKDSLYLEYHIECISMMIDSLNNNWEGAFRHYGNRIVIEENIRHRARASEIALIKNWSEMERRESENQILEQERQRQQKLLFLSFALLALILALVAALIIYSRKRIVDNKLLQKTNDELNELHKVKDKLFSLIAHDLRSPMSSFMSIVQVLSVSEIDPEQKETMLQEISEKASETYSLLNNLLSWSKSQMKGITPNFQYFEIMAHSDSTINQIRQQADGKGVLLENHIPMQKVYADPDMIDVVMRNLVTNAIKYSHAGDTVVLSGEIKGGYMEISVKDTGIGIPPEAQETLFKLSETTSRKGTGNETGSGLGLVLCADFVRLNGGVIRFESSSEEGSIFYFSIPLTPSA